MVTLLNFLAQILVHFSKTLEHQDHLVDLFSQCDISKVHRQRALSFHQLKVAPPVKGVSWMKVVNKTSFKHGAPPGVNEYRVPPGAISAFS